MSARVLCPRCPAPLALDHDPRNRLWGRAVCRGCGWVSHWMAFASLVPNVGKRGPNSHLAGR